MVEDAEFTAPTGGLERNRKRYPALKKTKTLKEAKSAGSALLHEEPLHPIIRGAAPSLVGRVDLVSDFGDALDDGPGAPGRATIYTGARGVGKTVMLTGPLAGAAEWAARVSGGGRGEDFCSTPLMVGRFCVSLRLPSRTT